MPSKASNPPAEGERRRTAASETNSKKPTRPLTAYHLFFQLEREYILQTTPAAGDPAGGYAPPQIDDRLIGKDLDPMMPYRYRYVRLSPTWYASGSGKRTGGEVKKRKHRKTHGKIGFLDLSKRIAARWAALEENDWATKEYVTRIARRELEAYRRKVKEHKKKNAASADSKVDSMDADEMKLWIEGAGGRSSGGTPSYGAGEAIATAMPPENIVGRAAAASSFRSQPAMTSFPRLKSEVHNMPYVPAKSMPSSTYKAAASSNEAKPADLKVNSMGAHEMKLWIELANRRFMGGIQTKSAGGEAAAAMLHENTGRAAAASSSQSQSTMPSFPWMKLDVNRMPYPSMELVPSLNCETTSSVKTDADASIGRIGGVIEGNRQLLGSNANSTAEETARMPIAASVDTLEKNAFNELPFDQATPSFWKQFHIAEKGGRRRHSHTSDPGIQLHGSEQSSVAFPTLGSSALALYSHGQPEAMLPAQPERVRHSFTSASSLFRAGGGGNSGQGDASCGITEMNYELDTFLSQLSQPRDQGHQGRGFNFGDITPSDHRPASAFDDAGGPSAIELIQPMQSIQHPPLGLEDAVGMAKITPEDAVGLMDALSDDD